MDEHLALLEKANSRIIRSQASGASEHEIDSLKAQRDECSATIMKSYESLSAHPDRLIFLRVLLRNMDFNERIRTLSILKTTDGILGTESLCEEAFAKIGHSLLDRLTPPS